MYCYFHYDVHLFYFRKRTTSLCEPIANCLTGDNRKHKVTESTQLLDINQVFNTTMVIVSDEERVNGKTERRCCSTVNKLWCEISIPTYILVCVFAISSWIDINGLFVELPLLVNGLPEGWNLPSYLAVIIQLANIGPLAYTVLHHLAPQHIKEWPVIYLIMFIGAISCIFLSFFWDRTLFVAGSEHSAALFILVGLLALVDCTSSVVYLPYMAIFKPHYLTALYIGEGLSGLLPGIIGLIQGVGGTTTCLNQTSVDSSTNITIYTLIAENPVPLFSVEIFFFMLFGIMCISCIAFSMLHFLPFCAKEKLQDVQGHTKKDTNLTQNKEFHDFNDININPTKKNLLQYAGLKGSNGKDVVLSTLNGDLNGGNTQDTDTQATVDCAPNVSLLEGNTDRNGVNSNKTMHGTACTIALTDITGRACEVSSIYSIESDTSSFPTYSVLYLLGLTCLINSITNGVLPSIQSYSALPYGSMAYTLVVRLSTLINPLACFLGLVFSFSSVAAITGFTLTGLILSGYQIYLAAVSPRPPLLHEDAGIVLVVSIVYV